jgi:DNA-binding transcriptional MerR regulator
MSSLPPKLYFRIGEVAGLVGVEPHVLRYWEREFRSIRPTKSAKGQRVYSRRDVENLMRVRELLYAEGFTIAGAKKKLQRSGGEPEERSAPEPAELDVRQDRLDLQAVVPEPRLTSEAETRLEAPDTRGDAVAHARTRTALTELRGEIEAFLSELGG